MVNELEKPNANNRMESKKKKGKVREYVEALLTAVIIAFFIRSFGVEAFKIPSGSMIPTLTIGDHIFVNKFIYGLRIPFTKFHFLKYHEVAQGDVIVFIYPVEEGKDFIKRVVGMPGDKVEIEGTSIKVNGSVLEKHRLDVTEFPNDETRLVIDGDATRTIPAFDGWRSYDFYEEEVGGVKHMALYLHSNVEREDFKIDVPNDHYFVMGDNRDNSADSRVWGFVPNENIKGEAMFVWLPLNKDQGGIRWHEFGRWIK